MNQEENQTGLEKAHLIVFLDIGPVKGNVAFWSKDSPKEISTVKFYDADHVIAWKVQQRGSKDSKTIAKGIPKAPCGPNILGFMEGYKMLDSPGEDGSKKEYLSAVMTYFWKKFMANLSSEKGKTIKRNITEDEGISVDQSVPADKVVIVISVPSDYTTKDMDAIREAATNAGLDDYGHVLLEAIETNSVVPSLMENFKAILKKNWLVSVICTKDLIDEGRKNHMYHIYQDVVYDGADDDEMSRQQEIIDLIDRRQMRLSSYIEDIKTANDFEKLLKVKLYTQFLHFKSYDAVLKCIPAFTKMDPFVTKHKEILESVMEQYIVEMQTFEEYGQLFHVPITEIQKRDDFSRLFKTKLVNPIVDYTRDIRECHISDRSKLQESNYYKNMIQRRLDYHIIESFDMTEEEMYAEILKQKLDSQVEQYIKESQKQDIIEILLAQEPRNSLLDEYIQRIRNRLLSDVDSGISEIKSTFRQTYSSESLNSQMEVQMNEIKRKLKDQANSDIDFVVQSKEKTRQNIKRVLLEKLFLGEGPWSFLNKRIQTLQGSLYSKSVKYFDEIKKPSKDELVEKVASYIVEMKSCKAFQKMLKNEDYDKSLELLHPVDFVMKTHDDVENAQKQLHTIDLNEKLQGQINDFVEAIQVHNNMIKKPKDYQMNYIAKDHGGDDFATLLKTRIQMIHLKEKLHDQTNKFANDVEEQGIFRALCQEKLELIGLKEEVHNQMNRYIEEIKEEEEFKIFLKETSFGSTGYIDYLIKNYKDLERDDEFADVQAFINNFPKKEDVDIGFSKFINDQWLPPLMWSLLIQDEDQIETKAKFIEEKLNVRIDFTLEEISKIQANYSKMIDAELFFQYDKNSIVSLYGDI
ncbi:hypothetical protein [Parasitella parasitica]|uniref:Uncharacterized protein n=1 Tax=Parasitella parasitica TaxID=35722 RepID=A0A0B7NMG5_9FUNG|nr:hypothetical protein [Parasitella parasitica]